MKLIFSISNKLAKSTKLELNRLTDGKGQNPGVQTINTHSTQIAWQFQLFDTGNTNVVIAIEAYSRYVLLLPFALRPSWSDVQTEFFAQWFAHLRGWMNTGGFVRHAHPESELTRQFHTLPEPECHRNLDMSINGHIADTQHWVRDYMDQTNAHYFEPHMAQELSHHINTQIKSAKSPAGKRQKFQPLERFLDDGLYRFAQGLCDQPIPGCAMGDFPNPYKRSPMLRVV